MDYRPAEFVRFIDPDESLPELLNEVKLDTWRRGREHAVLRLDDDNLILVRGGMDGIELRRDGDVIQCEVHGRWRIVEKLSWHVHPVVTGPSDHDCRLLDLLGQQSSVVYEICGEPDGTIFTAMSQRRK